jgi:beta-aspartyl-peptidase (threonine type)
MSQTVRFLVLFLIAAAAGLAMAQDATRVSWALAIHGGAGVIARGSLSPEQERAYRAALSGALEAGAAVLRRGGSSLDAVETTIRLLEDDPLFNAGRGAVFTADGRNELDASIMDGSTRRAGAVAGVTRTRNPISLARTVLERSPHVMLAREGADQFSLEQGLEQVDPSYFTPTGAGRSCSTGAATTRRRPTRRIHAARSARSRSTRTAISPRAPRRAARPASAGAGSATLR